jgi:superfamily I DNA/RNA helicase
VLVGKQVGPYTEALRAELRAFSIPFREENELQDLAAEPVALLIVDFLAVISGDRKPDAYTRLMKVAIEWRADDEITERRYAELRTAIDQAREQYRSIPDASLREVVDGFLDFLGQLTSQTEDVRQALREFVGSNAVRLMSIHKAKGLEFDVVVVLAVEQEMFWSDAQDERSAYLDSRLQP